MSTLRSTNSQREFGRRRRPAGVSVRPSERESIPLSPDARYQRAFLLAERDFVVRVGRSTSRFPLPCRHGASAGPAAETIDHFGRGFWVPTPASSEVAHRPWERQRRDAVGKSTTIWLGAESPSHECCATPICSRVGVAVPAAIRSGLAPPASCTSRAGQSRACVQASPASRPGLYSALAFCRLMQGVSP